MTIKSGDKMPDGKFSRMSKDGPQKLTTDELFKGKTVVLFSVPGAFTPTCDAKHLPGFVEMADQLKAKGVDTIACTAVNDVFVMNAWGKSGGVGDKILMLADGNGEYVKALEAELRKHAGGSVLVVIHHTYAPTVIAAVGGPHLPSVCNSVFDDLFVLVQAAGKMQFVQSRYGAASPTRGPDCK